MDKVKQASPRTTVQARFPDGRVFEGPLGTTLEEFIRAAYPAPAVPPMAAVVDGQLRELATPLSRDVEVTPVFLTESDGIRIYTRSLSFLLTAAMSELFPDAKLFIDHSVPFGGYYCRVTGRPPLDKEELKRLEEYMRKLVREDRPIIREQLSIAEAKAWFESQGRHHKAALIAEGADSDHVHLYRLGDFRDYFFGYMVPSAGYLPYFSLVPYHDGFILRFPRRERPTELAQPEDYSALWQVFAEYREWLELLGIDDVWSINEAVKSGRIREVILVSEALHEQRIVQISRIIAELPPDRRRLVLIAGPSSSGKTTFAKRLAIQLIARGLRPYPVSLDDYFLPREEMKRRGLTDFDDITALDLELLGEHVRALLDGQEVTLPRYNFRTGGRERGPTLKLARDEMILAEGIHALNPQLLPPALRETAFRIYVSALTQLNLDSSVRLHTTDTRLIRRIVRDAAFRGYSAADTLKLWPNVRRGEKIHIFPYQGEANVMFNSALVYEWAVLRPRVEPLLLQVRDGGTRLEAERLLATLRWIKPYDGKEIPATSILREFIGGSILRAYYPTPFERSVGG
jgi:uridine kinase